MIADVAGVMVRKSRVLGAEAWRGSGTGMMEDGGFVEGINSRWLGQVLLEGAMHESVRKRAVK